MRAATAILINLDGSVQLKLTVPWPPPPTYRVPMRPDADIDKPFQYREYILSGMRGMWDTAGDPGKRVHYRERNPYEPSSLSVGN